MLATPHLGYVTWETYESYFAEAFAQVNAFAAGAPIGVVNPEALTALSRLPSRGQVRASAGGRGPDGRPRRLDVAADLRDELLLRREDRLVAEPLPDLDDEPLAVEIAVEVEQVRLDPALGAAVVRVRADRDGGTMLERCARVDAVARADESAARARGSRSDSPSVPPRWSPATTMPSSS